MFFAGFLVFTILSHPQVVVKKSKQLASHFYYDELLQFFGSYLSERQIYLFHDKVIIVCNTSWNLINSL